MKIVLIDNEDSFTYNILNILRQIPGIITTVFSPTDIRTDTLSSFDKIIISPGPGLPHDFPALSEILDKYQHNKPILGICLGHQAIGSFYGAQLANLPSVQHGQSREISIIKKTKLFLNIPEKIRVGLYHSWVVQNHDLPEDLEISSVSEQNYIMSMSHKRFDVHGVQFHPESHLCEYGKDIIKNFVD